MIINYNASSFRDLKQISKNQILSVNKARGADMIIETIDAIYL